jgi:hypothetical protein
VISLIHILIFQLFYKYTRHKNIENQFFNQQPDSPNMQALVVESELHLDSPSTSERKPSIEMLLHLFCVEKNISVQSEKLLFDIIQRQYKEEQRPFTGYSEFKKHLTASYQQVPYTNIKCHIKNIAQKNYKPFDPEKIAGTTTVPFYDIKKQLELYLSDPQLSAAIIRRPTGDGKMFSSFTSGEYFRTLCSSIADIIPICCTCLRC